MSKEDQYERLSWLSDERKAHLKYLDQIVENKDLDALYGLKDNSSFSSTLHQILVSQYGEDQNSLNRYQMNLFLSMHLENSGQSSSILSFFYEWFPQYTNRVVTALDEIGARKSARLIEKAIALLPKEGSWFYDVADEKTQAKLEDLNSQFSDYPDGAMPDIYRKYAEDWKNEIISGIVR